jgi:hypothetical protein
MMRLMVRRGQLEGIWRWIRSKGGRHGKGDIRE